MILCAVGDLMLDLIVRLEQPLAHGDDTPGLSRAGAGGQAANVAAWAAALGAQSRLVAKWGGDTTGRLVAAEVNARRVEVLGPMAPGRNGVVVSIVDPDGERTMISDPGVAPELRAEELRPEWFRGCDALYLSGYALLRSPIDLAGAKAAGAVQAQGGLVAVDLSTWSSIREFGAKRFTRRLRELAPDVVFASERELEELGGQARRRHAGAEARCRRGDRRDGWAEHGVPGRAGRGGRLDRSGRRARGRVPRRRYRDGSRGGGEVPRQARDDAVSSRLLSLSDEVASAVAEARPVVALETTIVAHGFPPGEGLEVGRECEARVREAGAVPATVAVLGGRLKVGLAEAELEQIAAAGPDARKVGPRDLGACVSQGALGATTVGGTLAACRLAGVRFMATGGTGGVHRGYADLPDISADLTELARTEALVVCSGVKSLLDVPATGEALETLGIPVLGWRTDELPLFYTAGGGPPVSTRVDTSLEAASIASAHWQLERPGGLLLAQATGRRNRRRRAADRSCARARPTPAACAARR